MTVKELIVRLLEEPLGADVYIEQGRDATDKPASDIVTFHCEDTDYTITEIRW